MVSFPKIGLTVVGSQLPYLNNAVDVFVDKNNSIYVLERHADRVQIWLPNATSPTAIINASYGTELGKSSYRKFIDK